MTKRNIISLDQENTQNTGESQSKLVDKTIGERRREIIVSFQESRHIDEQDEVRDADEFERISSYEPLKKIEDEMKKTEELMERLLESMSDAQGYEAERIAGKIQVTGKKLHDLTRQRIRILQLPLSEVHQAA